MKRNLLARLKTRTARLAMTYVAIIMALSILFSVLIYTISSQQLRRPAPPQQSQSSVATTDSVKRQEFDALLQARAEQGERDLVMLLTLLNVCMLIFGACLSYYLARRTLLPIEEAMAAQSQFVSDASHELRTPLTVLQTSNEVMYRKKDLTLSAARELIGSNIVEIIKLRDLTSALLGLVTKDKASTIRQTVDIQDVISDAVSRAMMLASEKNITFDAEIIPGNVHVNRAALEQVLSALIDNAIKYSALGSRVVIGNVQIRGAMHVFVRDAGPGIAPEHLDKIFTRFYRVDTSRTSQSTHGYGLGLAIAQTICARQGMKIYAESSVGKGSTFFIRLP